MKAIKKKNFVILSSISSDETLRHYFLSNKTNAMQYSIVSEFWYSSFDFKVSSVSLSRTLGISETTLRSKIKDLVCSGILYEFKFSLSENKSTVYYVVNLSGGVVNYLKALTILLDKFVELRAYSLITTPKKDFAIEGKYLKVVGSLYDYFKETYLFEIRISNLCKKYFQQVIYFLFFDRLDEISSIVDVQYEVLFESVFGSEISIVSY